MRKIIAFGLLAGLGGCATVTRGTSDQIQISSEPSGAHVRTSLSQTCETPCTLTVSRRDEFMVDFSKEGYRTEIVPVKTRIAGAGAAGFAGNILVGGIVGMGVDAATGSTLEHVPNPVFASLQRVGAAPRAYEPRSRRTKVSRAKTRPAASSEKPMGEEPRS